jgi:DNA-binding MarR family transcriptional regulator
MNQRKRTALVHKKLLGEILTALSREFGGETTINQLRIGHYVGLKSLYEKKPTNNTEISNELGIPRSTASRIVADCILKGWVVEKPDPDDGRKKQLLIPDTHPQADGIELFLRGTFEDFLKLYEAGEITLLCSNEPGHMIGRESLNDTDKKDPNAT